MSEYQAIVICRNGNEVQQYRPLFPASWHVVPQRSALAGFRADALYVTAGVDISSDWFQYVARLRLRDSSAPVIQIKNLRMSWNDG